MVAGPLWIVLWVCSTYETCVSDSFTKWSKRSPAEGRHRCTRRLIVRTRPVGKVELPTGRLSPPRFNVTDISWSSWESFIFFFFFPLFPHLFTMKWWAQMPGSWIFGCRVLRQLFYSPLSPSSRGSLVHFLPLGCCHLHIWGYWYFSRKSWFQFVIYPARHITWCTLHRS